jgi:hypothetical protein
VGGSATVGKGRRRVVVPRAVVTAVRVRRKRWVGMPRAVVTAVRVTREVGMVSTVIATRRAEAEMQFGVGRLMQAESSAFARVAMTVTIMNFRSWLNIASGNRCLNLRGQMDLVYLMENEL